MGKIDKIFEYGFKAAGVATKISLTSSPSVTRESLVSLGTFYAPTKNKPENLHFVHCGAILDAILGLYHASNNLYSEIITQWHKPGCQQIIKQFEAELSEHHTIRHSFLESMLENTPDNEGWRRQEELIADFIKRFCNRPSDIKRGKFNIQAVTSPYLTIALVFRSMGDYLKLDFNDLNTYRGEANEIMNQKRHTRRHDKLVKSLRKAGLEMHYGNKIRDTALLWVRTRVLHSLVEISTELQISRQKLAERLKPFDDATGYIRQPG